MNIYPEYKDYNKVTVTFLGYTVSNINTKGSLPGRAICGVHLQSLSIKGTNLDNPAEIGVGGTLTLLDYKHSLFNILSNNLDKVIKKDNSAKLFADIVIEISCYSGTTTYKAHLLKWSVLYTGGVSTITVEWSVVSPDTVASIPVSGEFNTPESLIAKAQETYGGNMKFVYVENGEFHENEDVAGYIKFGASVYYNPTNLKTSGNALVDAYRIVATNSVTASGDPLYFTIEGDRFYTYSSNPKNTTGSSDITCDGFVFVQNGKWPAYYKRGDGKIVIPIASFSVDIDSSKMTLMGNMRGNFNGTQVVYNNQVSTQIGAKNDTVKAANAADGSNNNDPVTLKLDCFNIMSFAVNNKEQPISIEVYDEDGILVPTLSVNNMVRSVSYELSDAVVKASIECTNIFNLDETTAVYTEVSTASQEENYINGGMSSINNISSSGGSQNPSISNKTSYLDYKKYLCSEDSRATSLSKDKTEQLINNGTFDKNVDEFLQKYGSYTGAQRNLDASFVISLISVGNYGLLSLLISVANYGITGVPVNWTLDAVNLDPDYKNKRPFCASNTGKGPFDYTKGGLGIAHWDSSNLDDIYTTIGFDPSEVASDSQKRHFQSLLVKDNSIIGWKNITYEGIRRIAPVFSKKNPSIRVFDKGLKQDTAWLSWAKKVVYYRDVNGRFIYQHYLFRLWVRKFWIPTVNNLRKKQSTASHIIGLQDAARISRAGNSATSLINKSCGNNVEKQYEIYYNDKERYMRQKAFCRRCADIIGYCN